MSTGDLIQIVVAVLASLGGASAVVGGLAWWLGKMWAERIYLNTAAIHSRELESIRAAAQRDLEALRAAQCCRRAEAAARHRSGPTAARAPRVAPQLTHARLGGSSRSLFVVAGVAAALSVRRRPGSDSRRSEETLNPRSCGLQRGNGLPCERNSPRDPYQNVAYALCHVDLILEAAPQLLVAPHRPYCPIETLLKCLHPAQSVT